MKLAYGVKFGEVLFFAHTARALHHAAHVLVGCVQLQVALYRQRIDALAEFRHAFSQLSHAVFAEACVGVGHGAV